MDKILPVLQAPHSLPVLQMPYDVHQKGFATRAKLFLIYILLPEVRLHVRLLDVHHFIFGAALRVRTASEHILLQRLHQSLHRLAVHLHLAVNGYLVR